MLAIRFQRVGRKNHAEFRVVVQEARRSPSSGRIVAQVGHYNPHTKATTLDKEKAAFYLNNGAQPSPRVAGLFKNQGVELPSWVRIDSSKNRSIKNADKLRRNKPAEEVIAEEVISETVKDSVEPVVAADIVTDEAPAEVSAVTETIEA
jgi:small subunit ribosomal protein S16